MKGENVCKADLRRTVFSACLAKFYLSANILPEEDIINYYATTKAPRDVYTMVFFIHLSFEEQNSCFYLYVSLNNNITEIMRLHHSL